LGPGHAFVLHLFWSRACIVEGQGRRRWTAPASERVKIDESADKVDWCTGELKDQQTGGVSTNGEEKYLSFKELLRVH